MSEYIITDEQVAENRRLHGKKLLVMPVIVRCRDCREYIERKGYATCGYFGGDYVEIEPDGFCKWGERRA